MFWLINSLFIFQCLSLHSCCRNFLYSNKNAGNDGPPRCSQVHPPNSCRPGCRWVVSPNTPWSRVSPAMCHCGGRWKQWRNTIHHAHIPRVLRPPTSCACRTVLIRWVGGQDRRRKCRLKYFKSIIVIFLQRATKRKGQILRLGKGLLHKSFLREYKFLPNKRYFIKFWNSFFFDLL